MTFFGVTIGTAIIWIVLGIFFSIIEMATEERITTWFAIGSLAAALSTVWIDAFLKQLAIFLLVSLIVYAIIKAIREDKK